MTSLTNHKSKCRYIQTCSTPSPYAEWRYAYLHLSYFYANFLYTECHFAVYHGASLSTVISSQRMTVSYSILKDRRRDVCRRNVCRRNGKYDGVLFNLLRGKSSSLTPLSPIFSLSNARWIRALDLRIA